MKIEIDARFNEFKDFLKRIEEKDVPDDIRTSLYKFSSIRLCGHLEQCIKIIILSRIKSKAHPKLISYVKSNLRGGQNLKCNDIVELLMRFDNNWGKNLKIFLSDRQDIVEAVNSIYSIRNPLAHGSQAYMTGITLNEYFILTEKLVEAIIKVTR